MYIGGEWVAGADAFVVRNKFSGETIAEAAAADEDQTRDAVAAARRAFEEGPLPPYRRYEVLSEAKRLIAARRDEIVATMVAETGFTVADCAGDVDRCMQTLEVSAEEAKRITGEIVPIDGAPGQEGRLAFTLRVPLGVVCAITPFNSPLNTVAHKVAPALAAGNTVVLKPATYTPLSAAKLCEALTDAGLPAGHLNLINGSGAKVGQWLLENKDVRYYTFTGSTEVGEAIQQGAGLRRTQLELGNISATIVCADADLDDAVRKCTSTAFRKAGQVCTSLQRLYIERPVYDRVADALAQAAGGLKVGDPRDPDVDIGPMIDVAEAARATRWVDEAVAGGARIAVGGERNGALIQPTVLADVTPDMRVVTEEIFAPTVSLIPVDGLDDAISAVNATPYGLSCGIFTSNLEVALTAARRIEVGTFNINQTSSARVDLMPYGGVKASGFGREGPRYAIRDLTEERLVTITVG